MAAVLEQFSWPFSRRAEVRVPRNMTAGTRVLELRTAKEILAEIFEIDIQEVEEMIRQRCEDGAQHEGRSQWPERLLVEESPSDSELIS